jgi:protein-disulfide isomerase
MADVFISYAKKDRIISERLANHLKGRGLDVWWDTELLGSDAYPVRILAELDAAKAVIVIWSEEARQSDWVYSEADFAQKKKKLIQTRVVDLSPDMVPMPFGSSHVEVISDLSKIERALLALGLTLRETGGPGVFHTAPDDAAIEYEQWTYVKQKDDPCLVREFLNQFPTGRFAIFARDHLASIEWKAVEVSNDEAALARFVAEFNDTLQGQIAAKHLEGVCRERTARSRREGTVADHEQEPSKAAGSPPEGTAVDHGQEPSKAPGSRLEGAVADHGQEPSTAAGSPLGGAAADHAQEPPKAAGSPLEGVVVDHGPEPTNAAGSLFPDGNSLNLQWLFVGAMALSLLVGFLHWQPRAAPSSTTSGDKAEKPAQQPKRVATVSTEELMKSGPLAEIVLGEANAPVTIVEYADMTCGACANFHSIVLPVLKEKHIDTGKVRLVFREFPLNERAAHAFMTARCAGGDQTLQLIAALLSQQEEWATATTAKEFLPKLFGVAEQVGMSRQVFDACQRNEKLLRDIVAVRDRAHLSFGVDQAPTFFINGTRLVGETIEDFEKAFASFL